MDEEIVYTDKCPKCGEGTFYGDDLCDDCSRKLNSSDLHYRISELQTERDLYKSKYETLMVLSEIKTKCAELLGEQLTKQMGLLENIKDKAKRSSYQWSEGYNYSPEDYRNEGSIQCARELLELTEESK